MAAKPRVLVADDDSELLSVVAAAVESVGMDVVRAASGAELVQHLADTGPFDLLITDISMPWMTGLQAMHAARSAGIRAPVIVMTALRDESIPARVGAIGGETVLLRKPFELAELTSALEAALAHR